MSEEPTGFVEKMMGSIKGVLVGLVLIPVSFIIVFYASHREQASEVLEGALPYEKLAEAQKQNRAVFLTGQIQSAPLSDGEYLKPGNYLSIHRSAEMYAYVAKEEKKDVEKNGKKEKQTIYKCVEEWTSSPAGKDNGKGCQDAGKRNPAQTQRDISVSASPSLIVQGKPWAISTIVSYTGMPGISLAADKLMRPLTVSGSHAYLDAGCSSTPRVGCERLSFSGTSFEPAAEYTAVGMPGNGTIDGYKAKSGDTYLRLGPGKYEAVMTSLNKSDRTTTILLFAGAVFCLGLGMSLLVGPFLELIEYIPLIGGFGAGLIRVILFVISFFVIGFAFLVMEYWYLVLLLFALLIVGAIVMAKKKKAATA